MTAGRNDATDCPTRSTRRPGRTTTIALSFGVVAAISATMLAQATSAPDATATSATGPVPVALTREPIDQGPAARAAAATRTSSRSATRGPVPQADVTAEDETPEVVAARYTTVPLNVRTKPDDDSKVLTVLDPRSKVRITDEKDGAWQQVVYKDEARWVKAEYLVKKRPPVEKAPQGPSSAACDSGSGVEGGLTSNAIAVHRAVCNRYPQIDSYGGTRGGGGNHGSGHALDIMVSGSTGDDVANWLRANASELGISEIIWSQRIWTVQRGGEGWRGMSDRGGATDNHYDHVHVSVY